MRRLPRRPAVLTALLALTTAGGLAAQADDPGPLRLIVGTLRTEAEAAGIRLLASYAREISGADVQRNARHLFVYFTPDIAIQTGDNDAFNGVVAKVTGSLVPVRFITVDTSGLPTDGPGGIRTPRTDFFHTFPFSAGVETDRGFRSLNGIAEAGYVPWFQGVVPGQLKKLRVGLFVQGGYKAELDTAGQDPKGADLGSADESQEPLDSGLLRLKGSARWAPMVSLGTGDHAFGLGLRGSADVWRDLLNHAWYHRLEATVVFRLAKGRDFELTYEHGSGAPNFNPGDQFSANLAVTF